MRTLSVSAIRTAQKKDKDLMHVVDWARTQWEDPVISKTLEWLKSSQGNSLKHALCNDADTPEGKA